MWVDPAWYERNKEDATDPCPAAGAPKIAPLPGTNALIGRPSASRQVHPQIDCTPDSGVSRRHAQLLLDGDRWYVEDLGSTNGTFVAGATAALPDTPIPSGQRRELGENDRIYLGTPARLSIVDPGWGRRIHLDSSGSRSAVLWNPWIDKAKRLSQFAAEAWQGMLCIETANVMEDVVRLAAEERHALRLRLSSEVLAG